MRVAVSQRVDYFSDRDELRDAIDQRLLVLLESQGVIPFPVPNCLSAAGLGKWLETSNVDGVVLSGGNDIGSQLCRDETERLLFKFGCQAKLPILGICRGMQFLNLMHSGSLRPIFNHAGTTHKITNQINGKTSIRNSFHNFGIDKLGQSLRVTHVSSDDEIEGIRHEFFNHVGIMWHPEREDEVDPDDISILRQVFKVNE